MADAGGKSKSCFVSSFITWLAHLTWLIAPNRFPTILGREEFSDCVVKCGNKEWKCHKVILCLRSRWFNKALTGKFTEAMTGVVEVTEMDPDVLQEVLAFLYDGCKTLTLDRYD